MESGQQIQITNCLVIPRQVHVLKVRKTLQLTGNILKGWVLTMCAISPIIRRFLWLDHSMSLGF